jgi:hypothetical protein
MSQYVVTFNAKGLKGLRCGDTAITSFALREVDGQDEDIAANTAKAKGGSTTSTEELVRLSVVEVNGQPVKQPYLEFDLWNSRARAFALKAWGSINSASEAELEGFLAAAAPAVAQGS